MPSWFMNGANRRRFGAHASAHYMSFTDDTLVTKPHAYDLR